MHLHFFKASLFFALCIGSCSRPTAPTRSYKIDEILMELCRIHPSIVVGYESVGNEFLNERVIFDEKLTAGEPDAQALGRLAKVIRRESDYDCVATADQIVVFPKPSSRNPVKPCVLAMIRPISAPGMSWETVTQGIASTEGTKLFFPLPWSDSLSKPLKSTVEIKTQEIECYRVLAQIAKQIGATRWTANHIPPIEPLSKGQSPSLSGSILMFFKS